MKNHDPRCVGPSGADRKLLSDVAKYGWHVMMVLETDETPGWAYSVGLYKNFAHPEIVVFGLDLDVMHHMINAIGENVQQGKKFEIDEQYADLIEAYQCTLRSVKHKWSSVFLAFASWFYEEAEYPVLQCFWPDFDGRFPWDPQFDSNLMWDQPLLFHEDVNEAGVESLVIGLDLEVVD